MQFSRTRESRQWSSNLGCGWIAILMVWICSQNACGQADFEKGFQPYQAYHGSSFDTVNLANGNLVLDIPLISYEQRGGLPPLVISIKSNGTTFQSVTPYLNGPLDTQQHEVASGVIGAPWGQPHVVITPGALTWKEARIASSSKTPSGAPVYLTRFVAIDESGATHSLANNIANAAAGAVAGIRYSIDGSGLMLQPGTSHSGQIIVDRHGNIGGLVDPTGNAITLQGPCAQMPGTGDLFSAGLAEWEGYAHGTASATTIVDSVGRRIPNPTYLPPATAYSCIVDTSASYHATSADGCETWNFPGQNGGTVPFIFCYRMIPIASASIPIPLSAGSKVPDGGTNTYSCVPAIAGTRGDVSCETINESWWVLASVQLPNHKSWSFSYDNYGQVIRIDLPTGATVTYQYATRLACGNPPGVTPVSGVPTWPYSNLLSTRYVKARLLDVHDGTTIKPWTYDNEIGSGWSGSPNSGTVTVNDPDGNDTVHHFDLMGQSVCGPYETGVTSFQGQVQLGKILKTTTTQYSYQGADFANPTNFSNYTEVGVLPANITSSMPTASSSVATQTAYTYDQFGTYQDYTGTTHKFSFGQLLSSTDSDWNASGTTSQPGPILRTTLHTNMWQSDYRYYAANLIDLPCLETIFSGTYTGSQTGCVPSSVPSNQAAQTSYQYDEAGYSSETGALGLNTSSTRWSNNGPNVTTHTTYAASSQGMPQTKSDGNGNVTSLVYDDTNLFLRTVHHPATFTNGTFVPHDESFQYDANTGSLSSSMDANTQQTLYQYDDMRRLISVQYPDGGWESYTYHDEPAYQPYFIYQKLLSPSQTYTATGTADGLGRVTTKTIGASEGPIVTVTSYDNLGRMQSVTNPYLTSPNGVTSYQYDALGRKLFQCQQDNGTLNATACNPTNSSLSWQYLGNITNSSDELGHVWSKRSDGLGRLIAVVEPTSFQTTYSYDVLGNLLCADQWGPSTPGSVCGSGRHRSFTYDSLSRLLSSSNPESGVLCYGFGTGCTQGYDGNGNLLTKSDSRGVTTNYTYDQLNRVSSKSYGNDPSNTARSCYTYDGTEEPGSGDNLIGRLVNAKTTFGACVTYGGPRRPLLVPSLSQRTALAYDSMGRLLTEQQCTFATCSSGTGYTISYSYDFAGNELTHTNGLTSGPNAMSFTDCYDSTSRLSLVANGSASCSSVGAPPGGSLFSSPTYHPAGGLTRALFGTSLSLSRAYDVRLRIAGELDQVIVPSAATPSSATVQIRALAGELQ